MCWVPCPALACCVTARYHRLVGGCSWRVVVLPSVQRNSPAQLSSMDGADGTASNKRLPVPPFILAVSFFGTIHLLPSTASIIQDELLDHLGTYLSRTYLASLSREDLLICVIPQKVRSPSPDAGVPPNIPPVSRPSCLVPLFPHSIPPPSPNHRITDSYPPNITSRNALTTAYISIQTSVYSLRPDQQGAPTHTTPPNSPQPTHHHARPHPQRQGQ